MKLHVNTRDDMNTPEERPRGRGIPGHKLTMRWSGEYGEESSSTGECTCGWTESGSSQKVVRDEYAWHLDRVWRQQHEAPPEKVTWKVVDTKRNPVGTLVRDAGDPPQPQPAEGGGLPVLEVDGVLRRVTKIRPVHTVVVEATDV